MNTLALATIDTFVDRVTCIDALTLLRSLPTGCVHCIVTSPPYYGLRDYGVVEQIGHERTLYDYIDNLVTVFREARRVLRDDGTFWLNLGDSAASGKGQSGSQGAEHQERRNKNQRSLNRGYQTLGGPKAMKPTDNRASLRECRLKPKDLMLVPHRVAIALQEDGWYVRMDNVWHKPNPMPFSGTDRTTLAHEYVFQLAKSETYYYDKWAIAEPVKGESFERASRAVSNTHKNLHIPGQTQHSMHRSRANGDGYEMPELANKRSVWTINVGGYSGAHFATFPEELPETCILAGCPEGGIVLDMFGGAATTAIVARKHKRHYIIGELNPTYVSIARDRLRLPFERRHTIPDNDMSGLPLFAGVA